jgi:uncharacterized membrane-anchored protein
MKLATIRRGRGDGVAGVSGVARLDRRTTRLVARLNPGDIAIIDHVDLDRGAAQALVAAKVSGVVNAQPSISGRYPNLGPDLLVARGIALLDNVGAEVFAAVKEGTRVRIDGSTLYVGEEPVAKGVLQDAGSIAGLMAEAKAGLATQLSAFAADTEQFMKAERELLLDGVGVPDVRTKFADRHVVVVVKGYDYQADLAALKHYIREYQPLLVGVDAGADVLHEAGYQPNLIIGDLGAVADEVLRGGAEVVIRTDREGRARALARLQDLGIETVRFPASATSEDLALLLADERGASLIVTVGTHATLTEFLDKGRGGMASTFLTRMRVGSKLVDAKGVRRLYRSRISSAALLLLVLAALVAIAAALAVSETGRAYLSDLADRWSQFVGWVQGPFS